MPAAQSHPGRWETALEITRRVSSKEQSAYEVVSDALQRIDELNSQLGAVTFLSPEEALHEARALDTRISAGERPGLLAGIPTLMKDLYGFRPGWPTTLGGLPAAQGDVAPEGVWSRYPAQVTQHDALLLGETNSSTFGFCGATDNLLFGPTRNPFDTSRNSGGSSGGSAVAVAAGMVPLAGASDAGGSIRIPAAWTNTVGFQPSAGRVPSTPRPSLYHLAPHLYEGPITRTVADAVLALNALQGYDPHDPYGYPSEPVSMSVLTQGVQGLRIGVSLDFGGFPIHPAVSDAVAKSAQVFAELGAIVEPVELQFHHSHHEHTEMWLRSMALIMLSDLASFELRGRPLSAADLPPAVAHWTDIAKRMTAEQISEDRVMRTDILDGILAAHENYDLLIGPTVGDLPVENLTNGDTVGPRIIGGQAVNPQIGWCPTYLTNFTGSPSVSVPAGFAAELPVGMLIIGKKYDDATVLAAAAAFEEAQPWHHHYARLTHGGS